MKNFIPSENKYLSNHYYCTWNTQNFGRYDALDEPDGKVFVDQDGAKKARAFLNEQHLIDAHGFLNQYAAVRSDLWFLVDDGWDVPYGIHPDENMHRFGSLEVASDRFPSCTGTPTERLAALNRIVKNAGWRGLGLWVAAQAVGEGLNGFYSATDSAAYWKERLIWSNDAEIGYWKIDWGCHQHDIAWRKMINDLAEQYAPNLVIEHSHASAPPLNHVEFSGLEQISDGRFQTWDSVPEQWTEIARQSRVFRTYDVLAQLSQTTTVDRVSTLLKKIQGSPCILNCEDEVYVAAALGLLMGVMRSGMNQPIPVIDFDPQGVSNRLIEVERAVRWQRIAPAFSAEDQKIWLSDETVKDEYFFENGDTWMGGAIGKKISQACPAVVCRGIQPDKILYKEEQKPIFLASRHPNGAVSMATLPRTLAQKVYRTPRCCPVFSGLETNMPVGVFGFYDSVVLHYNEPLSGYSVWMQDLAKDEAVPVDDKVQICGDRLEVSGDLLCQICTCSDDSEPGVLIVLVKQTV